MSTSAPLVLRASPDYHLLVSRTTVLDAEAVAHLLDCAARVARYDPRPAIIVGATRCPTTGELSTSALNRTARRTRTFSRVVPTLACMPVDTFESACLLVPDDCLLHFGKRAPSPSLGLSLRRQGVNIFLAPGTVGTCPRVAPRNGKTKRRPGFATRTAI